MTTLHLAAWFGSASIIEVLVKTGAKVNVEDDDQKAPLHYAAWVNTSADVIRKLIKCGADVNACDYFQRTPLHRAAMHNHAVVPVLVEHGAKVNVLDSINRSPLFLAAYGSYSREVDRNAVIALCDACADPKLGVSPLGDDKNVGEEMKTLIRRHTTL